MCWTTQLFTVFVAELVPSEVPRIESETIGCNLTPCLYRLRSRVKNNASSPLLWKTVSVCKGDLIWTALFPSAINEIANCGTTHIHGHGHTTPLGKAPGPPVLNEMTTSSQAVQAPELKQP
eukprot:6466597-Amphidinium_carterae.2